MEGEREGEMEGWRDGEREGGGNERNTFKACTGSQICTMLYMCIFHQIVVGNSTHK